MLMKVRGQDLDLRSSVYGTDEMDRTSLPRKLKLELRLDE